MKQTENVGNNVRRKSLKLHSDILGLGKRSGDAMTYPPITICNKVSHFMLLKRLYFILPKNEDFTHKVNLFMLQRKITFLFPDKY